MKNYAAYLSRIDKKIRWLFLFSLAAFGGFMAILFQQKNSQEATRQSIYSTYSIIDKLERVNTTVVETESASRTYLISRDPQWKVSLNELHKQLLDSIADIRVAGGGYDVFVKQIDTLQMLVVQKITNQDSLVNAEVLTGSLLQKVTARGKARLIKNAINSLLTRMIQAEEALLAQRIKKNESDYTAGVWIAIAGGILALVLVTGTLMQLNRDLHRRRKAEHQHARSEGKYRNLIENAGVVMFTTDIEGRITFTNNHVLQLTGYSAEELIGQHFSVLIDPAWVKEVLDYYIEQFRTKTPSSTLHFLTRSKSGKEIWVEQFAQLLIEDNRIIGFQCMVRDISEKKKIELELSLSELQRKENELRLIAILDNTTALIFIKDLEGRYLMVNKRFKDMLGLTDEMVINKTDHEFNPKEQADHYKSTDELILRTLRSVESEEIVETTNGTRNLLVVKFPLLDENGKPFGISGIATDITERVQNHQQIENALQNAKEAKELQAQFLANMSHEIRTPLNGIQGMTSLLLETPLTEDQKDFAMMIKLSLNNLTAIVNDILDISNIRAGKLMLEKIVFNINDPIDAVKIQFANQVSRKGLSFNVVVDEKVPLLIIGDPYRLKQVLVSLVDNAIKFTKQGAVTLHVSLKEQNLIHTFIRFTIEDTGMGIPPDKLNTIFESFAQANMDISRSFGGAGLGLAISKGLVQVQGGNIFVDSTPGKGSSFSFYIPYDLPANTEEQTAVQELVSQLKDRHFLIVEDNQVNQQLIAFVLQKAGAVIEMASNGKEAIDYLEKGHQYDLVIMDLQMPVMDGYETAAYIRKTLKLKIPILALTATALKGDQEKCRELEIDDFMLKPFEFTDLYRRLTNLLSAKKEPFIKSDKPIQPVTSTTKLYDLTVLREMGDKESLLDIISLILKSTFTDIQKLPVLAKEKKWSELFKVSHKAKGSISVLQAGSIVTLMAEIEKNAREETNLDAIEEQVTKVMALLSQMEIQLREEEAQLGKELKDGL